MVGGKRVLKTNPRIEAYGTVDELNASIACLLDEIDNREDREFLLTIQSDLFTLGGYLATDEEDHSCHITSEIIHSLEEEIDRIDELIPPMKAFILPGGCKGNSFAHMCRTICRRAERCIYKVAEQYQIDPMALIYVNRLSDYFFLFSRKQSFIHHIDEIIWNNPCK